MSIFLLDTSGEIHVPESIGKDGRTRGRLIQWTDLPPFTQGYIEAAFTSLPFPTVPEDTSGWRFSDLAPETLAAMMTDCAKGATFFQSHRRGTTEGATFWKDRQSGCFKKDYLWPNTLYLAPDGKVHQRETTP